MTGTPPTAGTGKTASSEGLLLVREALGTRCGLRSDEVTDAALERSLRQAAKTSGASMENLIANIHEPASDGGIALQHLLRKVTVGETTFFRHVEDLDWLRSVVFPSLIARREREGGKRLRIWSAGCATGEEAHTLAILALEAVEERERAGSPEGNQARIDRGWEIQVLGSDINDASLDGARAAEYGEWSFRGVSAVLRARWFESVSGRDAPTWRPLASVRDRVEFEYLNLRDPIYPSIFTRTTELDLVLCRNVFLYFLPEAARMCLQRFSQCVVDGGFVLCGPADLFHIPAADVPELVPDTISPNRLRKGVSAPKPKKRAPAAPPARQAPATATAVKPPLAAATAAAPPPVAAGETASAILALLSAGDYAGATEESKKALVRDPLSLELTRCLALSLTAAEEMQSVEAWRKVLYLDPIDPGAHFGLGMALLRQGRRPDARAHFRAVVKFLDGRNDADTIAGPDALPVGWLRSACRSLSDEATRAGGDR